MIVGVWRTNQMLWLLSFGMLLGSSRPIEAEQRKTLGGHVPRVVAQLPAVGRLPASTNLNLALGLPLRNREALTNLLEQLYNPASPQYRQFLSSDEFTRRFAPTEAVYQTAVDYARANGLTITGTHGNRVLLDVRGSVRNIEKAFRTTLRVYPHPTEPRSFYSPDVEPSVPEGIPIQDMSGLDDFAPPRPMDLRRKDAPGTVIIANATGSGPGGNFMGKDFRAAYAPGVTNDGSGQIIGLFEFGPYYTNDIYMYETNAGLSTSIVVSNILLDSVTGIPVGVNADDGEEALDIDMAISMAPGAIVLVYEGNNGNDIFNRMATDNRAKQMSCSFGYSPMPASTEQIFQQYAAQGQSMFVASGDGGSYPPGSGSIMPQAEDPYLTIVGGTSLTTSGPSGPWSSESVWGGSGGGTSTRWGIPSWQAGINMQNNQGSTTFRNIPDVAMLADTVIFWVFKNGMTGTVGGTSAAAPLWAGFTALVNQEAVVRGKPTVGFLNPAIYALGKGPVNQYRSAFHDITTGNNQRYTAVAGYDLCTGWGSPTGSNTINYLIGTGTNDFTLYASPGLEPLIRGASAATTLTILPLGGFSGPVNLSVTGLPAGVGASLSSSNTTTTSVLTIGISNSAPTGTFSLIVTGTAGGIVHTFPLSLRIAAPVPGETKVNLASLYNRSGIFTDGAHFGGGADNVGFGYSSTMLGSAVAWNGVLFNLGPPNASDLVSAAGQNIPLPPGQYNTLQLLAAAVNGAQLNQTFTVTYSDNTTAVFTQSLSDWAGPSSFSGESVAVPLLYRNSGNGTRDSGTAVNVYGYRFSLDATKTVKSISLPSNGNVLVLALELANSPTAVGLNSIFNRIGIYTDGSKFAATGGVDGGGSAYSESWLGGAQTWNGTLFNLGPANSSNSVSCAGQTVTVPPGNFLSVRLLASGVQGNQPSQSFLATYSDASTTTISQSFSDWFTPQNYPGETKAVPTGYRNISGGSKDNRVFYLYGYSLPLNSAKTLTSIRLPNNANVEILAMSLVPNWSPSFLSDPFNEPSLMAGQPCSGTVATNVVDLDGDVINFSKLSGPAWLTVAANGSLSGTPSSSDIGTNTFVVSATDPGGLSASGTLVIQVSGAPGISASLTWQGLAPLLSWTGGTAPFQVQFTTNLFPTAWQPYAGPLNTNTLILSITNGAAFYRVLGQ
jgi:hypothetical protein